VELEAAVEEALPGGVPVELESRLVEGDPAQALESEADRAELLVVRSRGRSGIASVLLGSVSRQVVDHARCPVVVVKAPD
jgi:nucleotide-binding universal stress UspA family protein